MMSTNVSTLHGGSIKHGRAGIAGLIGALVLAAAALVALRAGLPASGTATGASNADVQKALIDVRAGERASRYAVSDADVQKALIDVRAGERAARGGASNAEIQKALIDVRAGERAGK